MRSKKAVGKKKAILTFETKDILDLCEKKLKEDGFSMGDRLYLVSKKTKSGRIKIEVAIEVENTDLFSRFKSDEKEKKKYRALDAPFKSSAKF